MGADVIKRMPVIDIKNGTTAFPAKKLPDEELYTQKRTIGIRLM